MFDIMRVTFKSIIRDRVFHGIIMVALVLPLVPAISPLSMRQVTELSITLSLSLVSFVLLLLAVFLGGTSLWKDIERRYSFSVLSLPIARGHYLLGKFLGVALFLMITTMFLGTVALLVVWFTAGGYPPDRPVSWNNLLLAVFYDALKYILLVAVAMLLSTVSTSFFLPLFGTISAYFVGNASQQVYDYVHSPAGKVLSKFVRDTASALYYVVPNFSAFNLKVNAIYGLPISQDGMILTLFYFLIYVAILLSLATVIFSHRELK